MRIDVGFIDISNKILNLLQFQGAILANDIKVQ